MTACLDCILIVVVKDQSAALMSAWDQLEMARGEIRRLHARLATARAPAVLQCPLKRARSEGPDAPAESPPVVRARQTTDEDAVMAASLDAALAFIAAHSADECFPALLIERAEHADVLAAEVLAQRGRLIVPGSDAQKEPCCHDGGCCTHAGVL